MVWIPGFVSGSYPSWQNGDWMSGCTTPCYLSQAVGYQGVVGQRHSQKWAVLMSRDKQWIRQHPISPDSELRTSQEFYSISNGYDRIKAIIFGLIFLPIRSSCQGFLDNLSVIQFTLLKDIVDVPQPCKDLFSFYSQNIPRNCHSINVFGTQRW